MMSTAHAANWACSSEKRPAVVVFSDRADLIWLRMLRAGFRHCFVAVRHETGWIVCEALANGAVMALLPDWRAGDVAEAYQNEGHATVVTHCRSLDPRPMPWAPFTCVEMVKRVLGLREPWIVTPFQLWKFLMGYRK